MSTQTLGQALTKSQLIEIVRTGKEIEGVARMRALAMLRRRPRRDVGDFFKELVADPAQQPRFRYMAAMGLYEMGGGRAERALADAAGYAESYVAPVIALGLGRLGTRDRMELVEAMVERAAAHLKIQAAFGATLLAYRHGLEGHDVRAPTALQLQLLGDQETRSIEIGSAPARDVKTAEQALTDQPLDVKLTADNAQRLTCEPNSFIWMWSDRATAELQGMERGVAGVLFRRSRFDESYVMSAIGLATPGRAGMMLTLHRPDSGRVTYAGTVAPDGSLQVRARSRPGVTAVDIEVSVKKGGAIQAHTARSARIARPARAPERV